MNGKINVTGGLERCQKRYRGCFKERGNFSCCYDKRAVGSLFHSRCGGEARASLEHWSTSLSSCIMDVDPGPGLSKEGRGVKFNWNRLLFLPKLF